MDSDRAVLQKMRKATKAEHASGQGQSRMGDLDQGLGGFNRGPTGKLHARYSGDGSDAGPARQGSILKT